MLGFALLLSGALRTTAAHAVDPRSAEPAAAPDASLKVGSSAGRMPQGKRMRIEDCVALALRQTADIARGTSEIEEAEAARSGANGRFGP